MKILTCNTFLFLTFTIFFFSLETSAQESKTNVKQDPKFEQLLTEKRKINASIAVNERYKIQIFSGDSEKAKRTLSDCKQQFTELDGTIVFNTPNYKVLIGNFRTRIEAERNLVDLKKYYENAFLIKPQK